MKKPVRWHFSAGHKNTFFPITWYIKFSAPLASHIPDQMVLKANTVILPAGKFGKTKYIHKKVKDSMILAE